MTKKEKHFIKFNRKEKKNYIYSGSIKLVIIQTHAILEKYLKLNFPVPGNGCIEIITVFCLKGFMWTVHRAINSTVPSTLFLTLQFLNFYIDTPLLCLFLESCLACAVWLTRKRSLAGLCSSRPPLPPTKSVLSAVWNSYASAHTYTYSLENVSFGIWFLQSRNIWEGDKNRIKGREAEKLETEGKS